MSERNVPEGVYERGGGSGSLGRASIYTRGQAYLRMGRGDEAAAEFQKILDHAGLAALGPLRLLAHLGLARAGPMRISSRSGKSPTLTFPSSSKPKLSTLS